MYPAGGAIVHQLGCIGHGIAWLPTVRVQLHEVATQAIILPRLPTSYQNYIAGTLGPFHRLCNPLYTELMHLCLNPLPLLWRERDGWHMNAQVGGYMHVKFIPLNTPNLFLVTRQAMLNREQVPLQLWPHLRGSHPKCAALQPDILLLALQ